MLYLVTDLPVSWRSLGNETFRLSSLRKMGSCIKPKTTSGDKTGSWQACLEGELALPAAVHLWLRNEGRRRGEILPIPPESGDTMAVTPFASKRDRKQSCRDI